LLAYYIAAINIEETYHDLSQRDYEPFQGIVLTDTFQLAEGNTLQNSMSAENSERAKRQKLNDIRVIIGNPPYSVGQESANDNNQNLKYEHLDERIEKTYFQASKGTGKKALYDSYVKAFRWASDRIQDKGMVCYVTNGSFIESNAMSGLRNSLTNEFSKVYCFNLRGNQRTSGETSRMEGGKIFDSGSRATISITLLIKNPEHKGACELLYHDIGNYWNRDEKLKIISQFKSINGITWQKLTPNDSNDWINQRNDEFEKFVSMGSKEDERTIFTIYSNGALTARDLWAYNFSEESLVENIQKTINFYNQERERFFEAKTKDQNLQFEQFIKYDSTLITWDTRRLKGGLQKNKVIKFESEDLRIANYRPFCKQNLYFNHDLNHSRFLQPNFFPNCKIQNFVICVSCLGANRDLSVMIVDNIADLHFIGDTQCFPLYTYEKRVSLNKRH
jgi:predicted helicase